MHGAPRSHRLDAHQGLALLRQWPLTQDTESPWYLGSLQGAQRSSSPCAAHLFFLCRPSPDVLTATGSPEQPQQDEARRWQSSSVSQTLIAVALTSSIQHCPARQDGIRLGFKPGFLQASQTSFFTEQSRS